MILDLKAIQVLKVKQDLKDQLVSMAKQEQQVKPDHKVIQDQLVQLVLRETLELKVQLVFKEKQVLREQQQIQEQPVHKVILVQKVLQVLKVIQDHMVILGILVQWVHQVHYQH